MDERTGGPVAGSGIAEAFCGNFGSQKGGAARRVGLGGACSGASGPFWFRDSTKELKSGIPLHGQDTVWG